MRGQLNWWGRQVSYDLHALAMQGSSPFTQSRVKVCLKEENLRPMNRLSPSSPTGEYLRPKAFDGQTQKEMVGLVMASSPMYMIKQIESSGVKYVWNLTCYIFDPIFSYYATTKVIMVVITAIFHSFISFLCWQLCWTKTAKVYWERDQNKEEAWIGERGERLK